MHFIETLLHIDPDHGSGMLELAYAVAIAAALAGVLRRGGLARFRRRRR